MKGDMGNGSKRRSPIDFGGKSKAAALVWARLGEVPSYIEPFAGSLAVLLRRPWAPARYETCSDLYCQIPNFWRAMQADPEAVAAAADRPVFECDLTAIHRWLQTKERKEEFKRRMLSDKDYYDAEVAGLWAWGASCWIGAGWCDDKGVWYGEGDERNKGRGMHSMEGTGEMEFSSGERGTRQSPGKRPDCSDSFKGVNVHPASVGTRPDLASERKGVCGEHGVQVQCGRLIGRQGVNAAEHAPHEKRPCMGRPYQLHAPSEQGIPQMYPQRCPNGVNVVRDGPITEKRPALGASGADLHGCAQVSSRGANLLPWFLRLQARLRYVRVCCGDWERICGRSVLEAASPCGVFLDPPYSLEAGRDPGIYQTEDLGVAHRVRAWCVEHGDDKRLRICLAGYAGEGHEELLAHGWSVQAWKASGGYSRIHGEDKSAGLSNRHKERLFFSPFCIPLDEGMPLFVPQPQEAPDA